MHGVFFPGICFGTFLTFDSLLYYYGSTGAVPVASLVSLLALWFGLSVPLVFVGAYLGYKREPLAYPTITSNIPGKCPRPSPGTCPSGSRRR